MKSVIICSFLLPFLCNSCRTDCVYYGNKVDQEVFEYAKAGYGVGQYFTYEYYLVFTNFENDKITIKELVNLSENFLDTVKIDRPVADIIFLGQPPKKCIPDIEVNMERAERFGILTIGFEGSNPNNHGNLKDVTFIKLWDKGNEGERIYLKDPNIQDSLYQLKVNNKW